MRDYTYFVYIATNKSNKVLYTGFTNSLFRRDYEHKNKFCVNSFTAKYNVNKIVYYETYGDVYMAMTREKQIKNLLRKKKIELINNLNPTWRDLILEMY